MVPGLSDIFKPSVGPSSSHTMGPMVAAARFLDLLRTGEREPGAGPPAALSASLHGSLAWTGKGHATDRAVALGLMGFDPATMDADEAEAALAAARAEGVVHAGGLPEMRFDPDGDVAFDWGPPLPGHANGLVLRAHDANGHLVAEETYYSVGGGFVATARELDAPPSGGSGEDGVPHPFDSMAALLDIARAQGASIAAVMRRNEAARGDVDGRIDGILAAMADSVERGLASDGILPGGLSVRRRAKAIHDKLVAEAGRNLAQPHVWGDWLIVYAMAVNEENAAGGRIVTAPTNGAAGVVPSVLRYYRDHCIGATERGARDFLLTAAAIGGIVKRNASISGAEVGCQGEVGTAAAMAAGGLCAALGGTPEQVENAAEIALEHHLGMTCDPAAGLVQVPCIERNGLGAIKAVSAASLSLRGDGTHVMPLDNCIEAMRQTGRDMDEKYRETSRGGLAVNLPQC